MLADLVLWLATVSLLIPVAGTVMVREPVKVSAACSQVKSVFGFLVLSVRTKRIEAVMFWSALMNAE